MSHCTTFQFGYSDERAIIKAFRKMNLKCSTNMVCDYSSDFSKNIISELGYLGSNQYRSIVGTEGRYQIFLCKIADETYEMTIERSEELEGDEEEMKVLAHAFKMAYIEVAVDEVVRKIENNNMPTNVTRVLNGFLIEFGPSMQYSVSIVDDNGQIVEDVKGVKGDFCTRLTSDIEEVLSHPTVELSTEFKTEYNMMVDDNNIQVMTLSF